MDEQEKRRHDDEALLRRVERTLTEIKVASGLSEHHASVLAALRIRLKGDPGKNLEDLLTAAGDVGSPTLEDLVAEGPKPASKGSLDEVLSRERKPKTSLDDVMGESAPKPDWPSG
jgi:hypothetical protein